MKGKTRSRLTWARLLAVVLTMYADRLPAKKRTRGIIRMLETLREDLGEGVGTPLVSLV